MRWRVPVRVGVFVAVVGAWGGAALSEDAKAPARRALVPKRRPTGSHGAVVVCPVRVETTILRVVPSGTVVKQGEVICELDPAPLRNQVAALEAVARRAEADERNARLSREAAELAVQEGDALAESELATARGEAELAAAEARLARQAFDEVRSRSGPDDPARGQAELALKRAEQNAERAARSRDRLAEAAPRRAKALRDAVAKAGAEESARKAAVVAAKAEAQALARQVERCRILAPATGRLLYARWRDPATEDGFAAVAPGAVVRGRQVLFRIVADRPTPHPGG